MSSRIEKREQSRVFKHPPWLGFRHDGYRIVPLAEYLVIRKEDHPPGQKNFAASTQSLLTFGLLEAVVEQHIPESKLVKNKSGRLVMTKDNIIEIVQDFIERIKAGREEELEPWLNRIHTSLSQAHSLMVSILKSRFTAFDVLGDDAPSVVCFIALISEALVNAKRAFPPTLSPKGFSWSMIWTPPTRKTLVGEMIADGWCPYIVEYLVSTVSVSSLEHAFLHGPTEDNKDHSDCSTKACETYFVDEKAYTPKHLSSCQFSKVQPSTSCNYSRPPLEEVKKLVLGEDIPVITVVDESHESPIDLKIHRASDVPYVAISHVWADGLGSTTEIGLPTCQLRRLASLVSKILPGAAFWTDGLCIPRAADTRKKAIGMMARTYSEAAAVLVLDGGLQLCHSTKPPDVKVLRVLTSRWMRRLWTLQEAVLAKELYLVFADTPLLLKDIIPHPDDMLLSPSLTNLAGELFPLTKLSKFDSYAIGDVARSLRWRTTKRPSDETLAIASLLGVHASTLVDLTPENRMIQLIQDIGKFPKNVLFLSGAKLQVPGFRWAMASFMASHAGSPGELMLSTQKPEAVLTARGLKAVYYALIFPKTTFERGKPWKLKNQKTSQLYEVRDLSSPVPSYTCDMLLLLESIPNGNATICVAVLRSPRTPEVESDGSFTVDCEYKRRLVISDEGAFEDHIEGAILFEMYGKLSVCVG
ncbi:hypothetical protein NUW58_g3440 [Xylaria curta]|uniref:Uncharacterized protein n=1 Tax=Xylaria curta TaxID=42375 RepID=A0ACC1PBX9_9PEZI|nr:hypothetical protein NUW58_g3440 [Xylaria curta]